MLPEETRRRIEEEPDFIALPKYGCSVARVLDEFPSGAPDSLIAAGLGMSEAEVEAAYQSAVEKLRPLMGLDGE